MHARRVVAAAFATAMAVGAPTSIITIAHRTAAATPRAADHQPVIYIPTGGYPGTFKPEI